MPALTGSAKAYKQARAGIARAGTTRANYFTPNVLVSINGTTRVIDRHSLRVVLNRNSEPSSATFRIPGVSSSAPSVGHTVIIGLGTLVNRLFAGQIQTLRHVRYRIGQSPRYEVTCIDWSRLFNRRLITEVFSGQSASDIATSIVENYTSGFTTEAIETGMATVDEFICVNEEPLAALARLAHLLGGGCYIDPLKRVHLWDGNGPSATYAPTNPVAITSSNVTLEKFTADYTGNQFRSLVACEGNAAQTVVQIPAGADLGTYGVPLDNNGGWLFNPATDSEANFARIGAMVVSYQECEQYPGPPAAVVFSAAAAGDVSVTVDFVTGSEPVGGHGWMHDGSGNYFAFRAIAVATHVSLQDIPATGYGALPVDLAAGTPLYQAHHLETVASVAPSSDVEQDIEIGEPIVVRAQVVNTAAETAQAAIEGGDGRHEHVVTDGDLTYIGAKARATLEADIFGESLLRTAWVTDDMNALPGTSQAITLGAPDVISATITVESVTLTFPKANDAPRRECSGSTIKLSTILDAIKA